MGSNIHLLRSMNFRLLVEAHPPKSKAKQLGFQGMVDDFLFPVHQSTYLLGLGCGIACYNDDNSRFVDLTRKVARRCNALHNTRLNDSVALLAKDPPRLRSWDGRRMAKDYNNVLYLSATEADIQKFADRLVGRASRGEVNFDNKVQGELERLYATLFGAGQHGGQEPPRGLGRILALVQVLSQWCIKIQNMRPSPEELRKHIQISEEAAISRIDAELTTTGLAKA